MPDECLLFEPRFLGAAIALSHRVTNPNSINNPPSICAQAPVESIEFSPTLIVAIDHCDDGKPNCFFDRWTKAPSFDAVREGRLVQRLGQRGAPIEQLQAELNAHGKDGESLQVDGYFGPKTEARVRSFQAKHGLRVDGVVGPHTMAVIAALKEAQAGPQAVADARCRLE